MRAITTSLNCAGVSITTKPQKDRRISMIRVMSAPETRSANDGSSGAGRTSSPLGS